MVSHLTVTAKTPTGASTTKSLNGQGAADAENGIAGAFAALLGDGKQASGTKATEDTSLAGRISKLVNQLTGNAPTDDADGTTADSQDPDAVAAAIDATIPIATQVEAKQLLAGLVTDLATLKDRLAAGQAADPELLKRIDAALDGLSAKLKIDLSAAGTPSIADLAALLQSLPEDASGTTSQLTNAFAPLAQQLLGDKAPAANGNADAAAQLQAVGEKLAKVLQALNKPDSAAAQALATDGDTDKQAAADADLNAALAKLLGTTAKTETTATPALGDPKLNLTELALTGKPVQAAANSSTAAASDDGQATPVLTAEVKADTGKDAAPDGNDKPKSDGDRKPDANAPAAAAPSAADIRNDAQGAAQNTVPAARVDALAPRVVQTGYQTSQQQLNLPQLAFELVRQVNDGNTRFQMRLDPPELGRIDVKLDIDNKGQVNAKLVVDKSETLDLMQRDQRALERALQQAGLDSSKTNLEFSLKQSPFSGGQQQQGRNDQANQFSLNNIGIDDIEEAPPTVNLYRASLMASGVNIIA